jgi:hypothetical protein
MTQDFGCDLDRLDQVADLYSLVLVNTPDTVMKSKLLFSVSSIY